MRRWCCILILFLPSLAQAQIAVDAVSSAESGVPGTSTSNTHVVGAAATFVGVCVASRDIGGAVQPVTSVTVGGVAATFVNRSLSPANTVSAELWTLVSPPTGSQTVSVTNNAANDRTVTTTISLNGVTTSGTLGTAVTAADPGSADENTNVDGIPSAGGELGLLCGCGRVNTTTADPDATAPTSSEQIERAHADATSLIGFIYSESGASPTIDMRVDLTPAERWAAVGVSIRPAITFRKRPMVMYP